MSIFDSSSNSSLHSYDLPDGRHVEVGYDTAPEAPTPGEYRLLDRENADLAVGVRGRNGIEFLLGDEHLYNLNTEWENYEDDPEYYDEPTNPKPIVESQTGYVQGDEIFVYFPGNTSDTEEQRKETTQLLANYVFGSIYLVSVTDEDGNEKVSYSIENYECGDHDLDDVLHGIADDATVAHIIDNTLEFPED